jgi:hypothetical protein
MAVREVINWEPVPKDNPAPIPPGPDGNRPARVGLAMQEIIASIARWRDTLSGQTGELTLQSSEPFIRLIEDDATANNTTWDIKPVGEQLRFGVRTDDLVSDNSWLTVDRTDQVIDAVNLFGAQISLGNFVFDADQAVGAAQDNFVMTFDWNGGTTPQIRLEAAASTVNNLPDLSDVTITSVANDEVLQFTGTVWENQTLAEAGIEPVLGNPAADGYLLQSTAAGVRSWLDPSTLASNIEVEDGGISLTTAVVKFNFAGAGVTVTEPIADEILVTIPGGSGVSAIDDLSDVTITTVANDEVLQFTGTVWENQTLAEAGIAATADLSSYLPLTGGTLTGNLGIGLSGAAAQPLDIILGATGGIRVGSVETDATTKDSRFLLRHYTNAEEDIGFFGATSLLGSTELRFGGGFGIQNAATNIRFFTAATNTTLNGVLAMEIDSSQVVDFANRPTVGVESLAYVSEISAGGISGSIAVDQVAVGSAADTIEGNSSLTFNSTTGKLTVDTSFELYGQSTYGTGGFRLDVNGAPFMAGLNSTSFQTILYDENSNKAFEILGSAVAIGDAVGPGSIALLRDTTVSADILAGLDSAYDIGKTGARFLNLWVDNINGAVPVTGGPFLPLAGGTLTGDLVIDTTAGGTAADLFINAAAGTGSNIYFQENSVNLARIQKDTADQILFYAGDTTNVDAVLGTGGILTTRSQMIAGTGGVDASNMVEVRGAGTHRLEMGVAGAASYVSAVNTAAAGSTLVLRTDDASGVARAGITINSTQSVVIGDDSGAAQLFLDSDASSNSVIYLRHANVTGASISGNILDELAFNTNGAVEALRLTATQNLRVNQRYEIGSVIFTIPALTQDNWVNIGTVQYGSYTLRLTGNGFGNYNSWAIEFVGGFGSAAEPDGTHPNFNVTSIHRSEGASELEGVFFEFDSTDSANVWVQLQGTASGVNNYVASIEGSGYAATGQFTPDGTVTATDPTLTASTPILDLYRSGNSSIDSALDFVLSRGGTERLRATASGVTIGGGFTVTSGAVAITTTGTDFTLIDTDGDVNNYFWRDDSTNALYLGSSVATPTLRADLLPNADSLYDIGKTDARILNLWVDNINGSPPGSGSGTIGGSIAAGGRVAFSNGTDSITGVADFTYTDAVGVGTFGFGGNTVKFNSTAWFEFNAPLFLEEQAAANADIANYGQFWVKSGAPNEPRFTDDDGTDFLLSTKKPKVTTITTPGSSTHTYDTDAKWAKVIVTGAGGAGGGANRTATEHAVGAGGGAGGTGISYIDLTGVTSAAIVVGLGPTGGINAGGSGAPSSYDDSTSGGGSTIITASGGGGGSTGVAAGNTAPDGGGSSGATGADINLTGGGAGAGFWMNTNDFFMTGHGAASYWGGGGRSKSGVLEGNALTGDDGVAFGSGGSGAAAGTSASDQAGGDGADGVVVIIEYY